MRIGMNNNSLNSQVGGNHYKLMKIQPVTFVVENKIEYREANIIKYVCRWRNKNGLQDLQKASHYLQMLIEEAENEQDQQEMDQAEERENKLDSESWVHPR
jgi:hypothetical protein